MQIGNTFNAVPSLLWRLSRVTKRIPYLDDFTSTHFFSSLKFSSNKSGWVSSPDADGSSVLSAGFFPPSVAAEAKDSSKSFDNIHQVKSANFFFLVGYKINKFYDYHKGKHDLFKGYWLWPLLNLQSNAKDSNWSVV